MEQQVTTNVGKTLHGDWEAETTIELGNSRVLQIRTSKHTVRGRAAGVSTRATGHKREGHFLSHRFAMGGPGGDFSRNLLVDPGKRGTEKAVREVHARALQELDKVLEEVRAYYQAEDEANATQAA